MSLLFGSRSNSSSSVPAASSVAKQRNKQIEYLREHVPNAVEVRRDELYRVDVTAGGNIITLDIKLPPNFPLTNHSPLVTVYPPMRHAWINEQMIVDGSPLIQHFGINSNLGKAIKQIIKTFTDDPPVPVSGPAPYPSPTPAVGTTPYPPGAMSTGSSMFYVPTPAQGMPSSFVYNSVPHTVASEVTRRPALPPPSAVSTKCRYQPPPIPEHMEGVAQMSTEELERYLSESEGPVLVEQYVTTMDVIKQLRSDRDKTFADNEAEAGVNIQCEPEMQESWTQLQDKFVEMQTLKAECDKLLEKQNQLTEKYQVKNIMSRLKSLTQEAETESEIIAEDFLDKKLSLAEFIQKYKQQRALHHERKSKQEKLFHSNSSRRDNPFP